MGRLRRGGDALETTFLSELPIRGLEEDFSTRWWVFVILPRALRFCCGEGCLSVKIKRLGCLPEEAVDCFGCSLVGLEVSTDGWMVDLTRLEFERPVGSAFSSLKRGRLVGVEPDVAVVGHVSAVQRSNKDG